METQPTPYREPLVRRGLRWALAGTFAYAGASKLSSVGAFAVAVQAYQLVPVSWVGAVAWGLPFYEILCAGLVLAPGRLRRVGLAGMALMALAFSGAISMALARGLVIDCGCFGGSEASETGLWWALVRAVLLLAISVWLYGWALRASLVPPPARA